MKTVFRAKKMALPKPPRAWWHLWAAKILISLHTLLVLIAVLSAPRSTIAAEKKEEDIGLFRFQFENDMLAHTDRYYTQALRCDWGWEEGKHPRWLEGGLKPLGLSPKPGALYGFFFAQNMYTPSTLEPPKEGDRSYAGWLYLGLQRAVGTSARRDTVAVSLGVIGPSSLAEATQKGWHDLWRPDKPDYDPEKDGWRPPKGWETQLKDEPAVDVMVERRWRHTFGSVGGGFGAQVLPFLGGNIGTVFLQARAGALLRAGWGLPNDWGFTPLPSLRGTKDSNCSCFHFFAGAEGRWTRFNTFLDGGFFRKGHGVKKEPLLGDAYLGVGFPICKVDLTFSWIWRSREFTTQPDTHRFNAVALHWRFN